MHQINIFKYKKYYLKYLSISTNSAATTPTVTQTTNYYPFGLAISITGASKNKYLYKGKDLNSIILEINRLLVRFSLGAIKDVMEKSFNGGKSFNFKNYADRVKQAQALIDKEYK